MNRKYGFYKKNSYYPNKQQGKESSKKKEENETNTGQQESSESFSIDFDAENQLQLKELNKTALSKEKIEENQPKSDHDAHLDDSNPDLPSIEIGESSTLLPSTNEAVSHEKDVNKNSTEDIVLASDHLSNNTDEENGESKGLNEECSVIQSIHNRELRLKKAKIIYTIIAVAFFLASISLIFSMQLFSKDNIFGSNIFAYVFLAYLGCNVLFVFIYECVAFFCDKISFQAARVLFLLSLAALLYPTFEILLVKAGYKN